MASRVHGVKYPFFRVKGGKSECTIVQEAYRMDFFPSY
jgi:hypothetical protein